MKTRLLFLLAFCMMCCTAFAQRTVKGQVVSDKEDEPLIGVAIVEKGTGNGTITDIDGNFSIKVGDKATLVISYVGYVTQQVQPAGNAPVVIRLEEDNKILDDVVVVGYGVQKKSDLTGAVASVKADDLKGLSTTDAGAALQGKAAGVQIIQSGAPGAGADIRVRGYSSNSDNIGPLLIVDGLKVDNIQYLDPSMIESMEVLKDAASAAIYGAQAGNGVILITTKTGSAQGGTAHITYNGKYTMQSLGKKPEIFDAPGYIEYQKYLGNLSDDLLKTNGYNGQNTNWYDELFDDSWAMQHSLTFQGGNNKGHFLAGLNLLDNDGIVKGKKDVYKRLTAQINADYNLFKWFNISTNTSIEKWSTKSVSSGYNSTLNSVISIDPLTPAYISDIKDTPGGMQEHYAAGDPIPTAKDHNNDFYGTSKYIEEATGNPLFQRDRRNQTNEGFNIRGTVAANLTPLKGLTVTSRLGYRIAQSQAHNYEEPYWITAMASKTTYSISTNINTNYYYQWENFANYMKTFNKHNVGLMVGMSFAERHSDNASISSDGADILKSYEPNFRYIDYLTSDATKSVGNAPNMTAELSYFGRFTYSYDNRYSIQANYRADAFSSERLSKDARWGKFPSFSAGWTISNEEFFKNLVGREAVSFLKLRGSWGRNGNVNVLNGYKYSSSIVLNGEMYQYNPSAGDGHPTYGSKPNGLANPDLKWETSEQLDFGLDARFLNDRLTLGIDWYKKTTKDLLIDINPLPEVYAGTTTVNAGEVENRGFDVELGWKDHIGELQYGVNFNFSTLHNEVKEVSSLLNRIGSPGISGLNNKLFPAFEAGYPIWYFRGYKYAGVNKETGAPQYYNIDGEIVSTVSDNDKQYLGEGIPDFTYGFTINLAWKGFDFSVFGTGASGNEIYNLMVSADRNKINTITEYWDHSWGNPRVDKNSAKYPDMKQVSTSWDFFSSSAAIFDGSYFKFKQIQLGYTVPAKYTKKALISDLRFSISLDDYFTITSYPGADPETASYNSGNSRGMDSGTYPTTKKMVLGVNLTF